LRTAGGEPDEKTKQLGIQKGGGVGTVVVDKGIGKKHRHWGECNTGLPYIKESEAPKMRIDVRGEKKNKGK